MPIEPPPLLVLAADAMESLGASCDQVGEELLCVVRNGHHEAVLFVGATETVLRIWTPLGLMPDPETVSLYLDCNGAMDELSFFYATRLLPDGREALVLLSRSVVPGGTRTVMGIQQLLQATIEQLMVARELLLHDQTPL